MNNNHAGDERRRFPVPKTPGNYPDDFVGKISKSLANYPGNKPLDDAFYKQTLDPQKVRGVLLAADIRNFTKTLEDEDAAKVQLFLNDFFKRATDIVKSIDPERACINKFLGDGLLAHIPGADVGKAIDAALHLILTFNGMKKAPNFRFANLSVALGDMDYLIGPVGGDGYTDYTLYGAAVNSLFRMLSQTAGGLVWITSSMKEGIVGSMWCVYVGNLKFKGIVPPVTTYSVIRARLPQETRENAGDLCVRCENYRQCQKAWQLGRNCSAEKQDEYLFNLDCNECGNSMNQCWLWNICSPKYRHAEEGKSTDCCYMCKNFRNCFHCFQLGRQGEQMVSCNKELYENFTI